VLSHAKPGSWRQAGRCRPVASTPHRELRVHERLARLLVALRGCSDAVEGMAVVAVRQCRVCRLAGARGGLLLVLLLGPRRHDSGLCRGPMASN
jgi:hypothetical protein